MDAPARTTAPNPLDRDLDTLRAEVGKLPGEDQRARLLALLDAVGRRISRLEAVVQDHPDPLFRFHGGGRITFANRACCEYWGRERVELLGRPVNTLLLAEGWDALLRAAQRLTLDDPVTTLDVRVTDRQGRARWQRWSVRLVGAEPGEEPGPGQVGRVEYQVVATDVTVVKEQHQLLAQHITERRRLERQHRRVVKDLQARLDALEAEHAAPRGSADPG